MTKIVEAKRHINIDVSADIAEHIRRQPHQSRYIEDLVRRDMAKDESLLARIEQLENAVHQKCIKIDGLEFRMFGENYSHNGDSIVGFSFNVGDQPLETLAVKTLADGETMRSFAFRNELGHYVGRAVFGVDAGWAGGFKLQIETISRIGSKLYSAADMSEELANTPCGWDTVGKLNRLELLTFRVLRELVSVETLDNHMTKLGIDKVRLEQFTSF